MKRLSQSLLCLAAMLAWGCLYCLGNDVVSDREAVADYYNRMHENTKRAARTPAMAEQELQQWREQRQVQVNESINQPPVGFAHYENPGAATPGLTGNSFSNQGGSRQLVAAPAAEPATNGKDTVANAVQANVLALLVLGFLLLGGGYVWRYLKKAETAKPPPPERPRHFSV